jgi:hypothetical protein
VTPAQITITKGPNSGITAATPDGVSNPDVCGGGGTPVPAVVEASAAGPTTTELITNIHVTPVDTSSETRLWDPLTTYHIKFAAGISIAPKQGGAPTTDLSEYEACFHTTQPSS